MDKQLARRLHVLIRPEVQEALNELLEHRRSYRVNEMVNSIEDRLMHQNQGAIKELEYLLKIRDTIIHKAE